MSSSRKCKGPVGKGPEQPRNTYIQHNLVQELQHIAAEHVGQQAPIDLAPQSHQIHVGMHITVTLEIHNSLIVSIGARHMGHGFGLFLTHHDGTISSGWEKTKEKKGKTGEQKTPEVKVQPTRIGDETTKLESKIIQ